MTITLGREMEKYGIGVNAIAPRAVTRMTETLFAAFGDASRARAARRGNRAFDPGG